MLNVDIYCCAIYSELYLVIVACCEQNDAFKSLFIWLNVVVCYLVVYAQLSNCIYVFIEHGQLNELVFHVVC
jgi:hypothetical protein